MNLVIIDYGSGNLKSVENAFKNSVIANKDPVKSILLSVKDIAYNSVVKAIIVFSNLLSGTPQTSSSIQLQLESEKIKKAQTTYFIDVNIFAKSSNYLASIIGLPSLSFSSPNHMVAYPP